MHFRHTLLKRFATPGRYIIIRFDAETAIDKDGDYLTFFKDSSCSEHWGDCREMSGGTITDWPGVAGTPPLVIPADSVFVHFHTDSTTAGRGFSFTAEAPVSEASAEELVDNLRVEGNVDDTDN